MQGGRNRHSDKPGAWPVSRKARQDGCSRVIHRACGDKRGAEGPLVWIERTLGQESSDKIHICHFDLDILKGLQIIRQTDIHDLHIADVFKCRQFEQSLLDRRHGDSQVSSKRFVGHFTRVTVHTGRTIHRNHERGFIHAIENVIDLREQLGHILFQWQLKPGTENSIQKNIGIFNGFAQLLEWILARDHVPSGLGETPDEIIFFALDQVDLRFPALCSELGQGDERVAAIFAGTYQANDFSLEIIFKKIVNYIRKSLACVFHHLVICEAAGIGLLFDRLHLGNSHKFHVYLSYVDRILLQLRLIFAFLPALLTKIKQRV